ncbi:sugar kinase [Mongoliitalea daihaiensis]|uniref:sugar kinase n=1 Tax=Mongoliitalea daihaiensis TaxID=2782006 RepID=UPI001F371FF2|nr:sugar kinase [Mongoliitalea daihaiensis]UJP65861.1 sugar kinase [Mongoliitalea daihaiensis]
MRNKIITIGEIMMRLSTPGHERFVQAEQFEVHFGGAEANVAISLAHWGQPSQHVTALPAHDLGLAVKNYLRKHLVDCTHVYAQDGRLGLYFLENGVMQRASKIIYDRFDSAFANWDASEVDWDAVFLDAAWFHWTGITPALSQAAADFLLKALKAAKNHGVKVSADINYRRNLWNYGKSPLEIMPELIRYADVVIAGLTDFENCMDIQASEYVEACHLAKRDYPSIAYISTTERETISSNHNQLSAVLWNGQELLTSKSYDMPQIVDRIGGGDAYMAGLIYGLLHMEQQAALEFAVAASVLKHGISGDANLVSVEEVQALVAGNHVGKLLR